MLVMIYCFSPIHMSVYVVILLEKTTQEIIIEYEQLNNI